MSPTPATTGTPADLVHQPVSLLVVEHEPGKVTACLLEFALSVDADSLERAIENLGKLTMHYLADCERRKVQPMRPASSKLWNLWLTARAQHHSMALPVPLRARYLAQPIEFQALEAAVA